MKSQTGRAARAVVSLLLASAVLSTNAASARVVLIGIDGGSWNLIDPLMQAGELPNLQALSERGATAELETVEPVVSPVVWTSISTGHLPEEHGITDFYGTRFNIKVPTVFERLAAKGLRVGLYDYLVTWPAARFPEGFVVPGWLRRDETVAPTDAWQRSKSTPFTVHYDDLNTSSEYLALSREESSVKAERWNRLSSAFDVEVGAVTFYGVDMTSHRFWHAAFPDEFDPPVPIADDSHRTAIFDAVKGIDRAIGEIVKDLGPNDTVLIASDHGFFANPKRTRSVWVTHFEEAAERIGLDPERDGFAVISTFGGVIIRVHPGDFAAREAALDKLVGLLESYTTDAGDALFLVSAIDVAERPAAARRPFANRLRQWVTKQVTRIAFDLQIDPSAHAMVFALPQDSTLAELWPTGIVRVAGKAQPIKRAMNRQEFTGEHDPIGIFIAAGGPIAKQEARGQASVLDIAPLIFYLAGQPIPSDLPGKSPEKWISEKGLATNPPRVVDASEFPALPEQGESGTFYDPGLREKLRALGYVQ